MNHNERFQPRDLAELRDIVAPMLARMIKGSDITTHGAMHAALLANQHYGDVWAAATQCEILYGRARLTSSAVLGIMAASGKVQIEYEEQSTTRVCIVATRETSAPSAVTGRWNVPASPATRKMHCTRRARPRCCAARRSWKSPARSPATSWAA
jgi:hypothetical protein